MRWIACTQRGSAILGRAALRRDIRLREFYPGSTGSKHPVGWQIEDSDGSLTDQGYLIEADADGFISSALPQNEMKEQVIVLGDSVVECMFVEHGRRLTDHAEMFLNDAGLSVAVRNGGVSGATSLHMLNAIINKIVPLRPKLIIVASGIMDQNCMKDPDGFWTRHPYFTPVLTQPSEPYEEVPDLPELQMADRLRILRLIKLSCAEFGLPLAIATVPHRGNDAYATERGASFLFSQERRRLVNAQTRDFAAASGLPLIDMEAEFRETAGIFYDHFHLNSEGAVVVGRYLADEIRRIAFTPAFQIKSVI